MRAMAMCPITVQLARVLRDMSGEEFDAPDGRHRLLSVVDVELAADVGLGVKRTREALLKLERLGALLAEDLLPGPSAVPRPRAVLLNLGSAAWRWLAAFDALEVAFDELQGVSV